MKDNLYFFYGSLRQGYWNQRILSPSAKRVGSAKTIAPFALYIGKGPRNTVPTCVPFEGTTPLVGELYELSREDAKRVHTLETGYEHGLYEVVDGEGHVYDAYIFHHKKPEDCAYIRSGHVLVPSGDYTDVVNPDATKKEIV